MCGTYTKSRDIVNDCCQYYTLTPNTKSFKSTLGTHYSVLLAARWVALSYGGVNAICQLMQSNKFWWIRLVIDFLLLVRFATLEWIFRYELWPLFFRDSSNITADISSIFSLHGKLRVGMYRLILALIFQKYLHDIIPVYTLCFITQRAMVSSVWIMQWR